MIPLSNTIQIKDIILSPGEFFFGSGYSRIHTLLGSCVAITMWHPQKKTGGMCHYLLPSRGVNQRLTNGNYADEAVELFVHSIKQVSTRPHEYEVKIFGGGNMFASLNKDSGPVSVSRNNIDSATVQLLRHGFTIKATDVGGNRYRKIYFELWNGDVWVLRGSEEKGMLCQK